MELGSSQLQFPGLPRASQYNMESDYSEYSTMSLPSGSFIGGVGELPPLDIELPNAPSSRKNSAQLSPPPLPRMLSLSQMPSLPTLSMPHPDPPSLNNSPAPSGRSSGRSNNPASIRNNLPPPASIKQLKDMRPNLAPTATIYRNISSPALAPQEQETFQSLPPMSEPLPPPPDEVVNNYQAAAAAFLVRQEVEYPKDLFPEPAELPAIISEEELTLDGITICRIR